jgi:nucleoside transporter
MNLKIKSRLSLMMFLQYFVWGAWSVTLGTWLATSLRFSGQQIGWAAGTTAIGAIISPFFVGLIADRFFSTQKMLGVLHAIGAVLLVVASQQSSFVTFYVAVLLYSICYMPTLALTNSLAFRQMQDPQQEFGMIRVFGTIGWIVAGLIIGNLGMEATAIPMRIAAACSLLLALYCFTLPHTPPLAQSTQFKLEQIIPKEAIQLFRNRSMAIFAISSFLICIPLQFYYAFTNLFLNEIGVQNSAAKMTGGQMSELFCMLLIPWFFRRLGVKYMLGVGMLAWAVRYVFFAYGNSGELMWMLWAGILLHGICYDFFFVVGQIYIDREAPVGLRAAAQGMITLITYGAGMLVGSWLSGRAVDAYAHAGAAGHDWQSIWIISASCSAVVLVLFLCFFSEKKTTRPLAGVVESPTRAAS